jgi:transcriptional regulator with XRE-family HTH domain
VGKIPTMTISDRIAQRLELLGLSQRAASMDAGLNESFIRDLGRNKGQSPRVSGLEKLATVLKTNVEWLMTGAGDPDQVSDADTAELVSIMPSLDAKKRAQLAEYARFLAQQKKRETGE